MANLDNLAAQVATTTSVEQSAILLIQGLAVQIGQAGTDQSKLDDLQKQLNDSASALAAAIVAGTPAAPAPVVTPAPDALKAPVK